MRLVCPTCQATYDVPDAALAAAPRVRCVKCAQEWTPSLAKSAIPGASRPALDDTDFVRNAPAREPMAGSTHARRAIGPMIGWAATVVVLIAFGWAAYTWRGEVMHAWPASTRLYAALGLGEPAS